jgi:nucleoside-diphosphate-sugar epimerase
MRLFLTGATGYIGGAATEALRARGHDLSGLARSDAAAARLAAAGITAVRGDYSDPSSVAAGARAADGVIAMGSSYDPPVDGRAVDAVLDALAGSDRPFLYTSGIFAQGDTAGAVVDETSPLHPAAFAAWRPAVDDRVRGGATRAIRSVVIRPAIVYGRGGGIPAGFADSARADGAARYVGTGDNRWALVHVDDLADLYALALDRAAAGTLLLAVHGPSLRVRDLAAAASRGAGAGGRTVGWPLEEARRELGAYADALVLDHQASGARAKALGWRPHRPDALADLEHGSYVRRAA